MSAHEAGRALDVLIAERIMELRVVTIDQDTTPIDCTVPADAPEDAKPDRYLASYSTDIRDAWEIAAKCAAIRKYFCVEQTAKGWNALMGYHVATADTAPLAMCRVALAAMKVPV